MNKKYKVLGVITGKTKKGNDFTVLHLVSEFDDYNISRGAIGQEVSTAYVSDVVDVSIGSFVSLVYGVGYQGKAIVVGVNVLK